MIDYQSLTFHTLTALPYHNANRDDRGLGKQTRQGDTTRGLLSAQSKKRAARVEYELDAAGNGTPSSVRSRELASLVARRAVEIAEGRRVDIDVKATVRAAAKAINALTKTEKPQKVTSPAATPSSEPEKELSANSDTVTWLSGEEIDTLAGHLVDHPASPAGKGTSDGAVASAEFISNGSTASLAIAAFGRMFAANPDAQTEAALSGFVSITTHPITVDIDYLTAVDDLVQQGAAHLAQAFYTSGVYYCAVTIDKRQLRSAWLGWDAPDADTRLTQMLRAVLLALPQGRQHSTNAARIRPALIIAEQQLRGEAYNFEEPVAAAAAGGYLIPSAEALVAKANAARRFDPDTFGPTLISGEQPELGAGLDGDIVNLPELIAGIIVWLRA